MEYYNILTEEKLKEFLIKRIGSLEDYTLEELKKIYELISDMRNYHTY